VRPVAVICYDGSWGPRGTCRGAGGRGHGRRRGCSRPRRRRAPGRSSAAAPVSPVWAGAVAAVARLAARLAALASAAASVAGAMRAAKPDKCYQL